MLKMVRRPLLIIAVMTIANAICFLSASISNASSSEQRSCNVAHYVANIVNVFPHSKSSFTQGLVYESGRLYESIGLYGQSALLSYGLDKPVRSLQQKLSPRYFAEGLTVVGDELVQLTYKSGKGFVYAKSTLKPYRTFDYDGEGWGLTFDGTSLIMSDGTSILKFLSTKDFGVERKVEVKRCGKPLKYLNELEYIDGTVYANVWQSNKIVIIDPAIGLVIGEVDLNEIVMRYKNDLSVDVLNGIAWDSKNRRMFITGKHWPHLYEIELQRMDRE